VSYLDGVERMLAQIAAQDRLRQVEPGRRAGAIDFSSNDYLGLACDPSVVQALRRATRVGSGGSRLLGGRDREHQLLEEELAAWLGRERALLFSSGYLAALGAIGVLSSLVSCVYSDRLNHACLIDGIRLGRSRCEIYPHAALPSREQRRSGALVVSESIFSMDGDTVAPAGLLDRLGEDDVLLIDEAHALGVVGSQGAGLACRLDDPRVVVLGTLSKSLGGCGGFVAGPARLVELFINTARSFIFDTALPPSLALAARIALVMARRGDDRRAGLHAAVARLRTGLRALGHSAIEDLSPIVPVLLGEERRALYVAAQLAQFGLIVPAIRPPTVPAGTSRLRISVRADHTREEIDLLIARLGQCIATS
jgi:8-amino-7-oxononanoate synthase